jgi:hypothetical protein
MPKLEAHLPLAVEAQLVIVAQENLNGIWSAVAELPLLRRRSSTHLDTEVGPLTISVLGLLISLVRYDFLSSRIPVRLCGIPVLPSRSIPLWARGRRHRRVRLRLRTNPART